MGNQYTKKKEEAAAAAAANGAAPAAAPFQPGAAKVDEKPPAPPAEQPEPETPAGEPLSEIEQANALLEQITDLLLNVDTDTHPSRRMPVDEAHRSIALTGLWLREALKA